MAQWRLHARAPVAPDERACACAEAEPASRGGVRPLGARGVRAPRGEALPARIGQRSRGDRAVLRLPVWAFSVVLRDMGISDPKLLVLMGCVLVVATVAVFAHALWRARAEVEGAARDADGGRALRRASRQMVMASRCRQVDAGSDAAGGAQGPAGCYCGRVRFTQQGGRREGDRVGGSGGDGHESWAPAPVAGTTLRRAAVLG